VDWQLLETGESYSLLRAMISGVDPKRTLLEFLAYIRLNGC